MPDARDDSDRERLVDATLNLGTSPGFNIITIDHIADAAAVTPSDFARHFASKEAVIMSIVDDLLRATATTLGNVESGIDPERALLAATVEVVGAIIDGRGVITVERMLAMARIITTNSHLLRQASAARMRVLTQALADWMGVDAQDRRVHHAVRPWSAIAAGAHIGHLEMMSGYDPRQDQRLSERMIASLSANFDQVMGHAPW